MPPSSQAMTLIYESGNSLIYHQPAGEYDIPVVLKVLNTNYSAPQQLVYLNNEYQITNDLTLQGVRRAIAQTRIEDKPALLMEYIDGQTLKQAFVEQSRSLLDFLQVGIQIAQTLGEVHQHHIVHQDINSYNILVKPETKQIKLIDFGLASRIDLPVQHLGNPERLAGTLTYLSPEQTGRMNRVVDYRTDLYSLGVTFYEMLTGQLPFDSDDPLALVHAHMAKAPRPVTALNPDVPPLVSDIVLKLLAKNAEDRYQSAFGLKADLERCLAALTNPQGFKNLESLSFELGQDDYSGQLSIPQKLYGRTTEIARLLASFERAAAGSQELMLVAGYAGVGKSALVAEVHKPITEKRGYFISGKFDQRQRNTPYLAFTQAFNQFADLLLTERETTLHQWRDKILAAVGSNGAVLTEVIPRLEKVIGPQPAGLKLDGPENRNRFNLTFQNFVQAISTAKHPLVIFIDDWQWADSASLELLKILLTNEANTHLLLIGAYRDNEVDGTHAFMTTLNDLTAAGRSAQTIQLGNLQVGDVRQLIQESLACSTADSQALTELVYGKTQGNAFFTRQFLQNLYEEGWLRFDFNARCWLWDIAQIESQNITDNVVDLMTGKLKRLSPETANLLQLAACIGNEFDLHTLALISQLSISTMLEQSKQALTEGLLIPLDDYYKLPDMAAQARFSFLHDRVQQAAYAQIPAPDRQTVHLEIGRLLLANTPAAELEQRVFDIVQHYNQAINLITTPAERWQVAELNIQAADLAYRAAAFKSAQVYLETALSLLPDEAWISHYERMLALFSQLAIVLSLTGDFEQMRRVVQITETQAHTVADTAQVTLAKIQGLLSQGNYAGAIDAGLTFVEAMGVPINRNPSAEEAFNYFQETAAWLTEKRIETLPHLPEASAEMGLIMEIAVTINGPIFGSNMNLCLVFVSRITRLCLEQGLAPWSPVTLATFALLLSATLHDIPKARLLKDVTLQLFKEKYPADSLIPFLSVAIGGFITHRYEHLKHTLPIFADGMQKGLATGGFQFAGYCAWWYAWHHLFLGVPLVKAEAVSQQTVDTCQKIQMERFKDWSLLVHQATLNLQGKSESPWILKGDAYDKDEKLALALQLNDYAEVFRIFFFRGWLHYLFDQPQAAVMLFQEAESYLVYGSGLYLIPLFYFYDTLANAAVWDQSTVEEQSQILERINRNLEQIEVWVRFAPMNHRHKQALMEAEKARLEGRYWQATTFYEKAIKGARENEFLNEKALAYELCGKFWLEQGNQEIATLYLQKAQNSYDLWGAAAKVEQLQAAFGERLGHRQAQPQDILDPLRVTPLLVQPPTSSWLDINSLLKANQTLSQTVQLADLLAEMVNILLENAGAERALILYQTEGDWFIEASGQVKDQAVQTGLHLPLTESGMLSMGVFNYVFHSGQAVVLVNAREDPQFGTEAYLREHEVKSVLCLPIWHQGELRLVLYLENNLIVGAFTENRIGLLQLLSGQMAISLENALMVDSLRTSIAERKQAEAQLERNLRQTRVRFEVSQALAGAETEDEVLDALIQHAGLYPQVFVAIFTFDRTGGELVAILRRQDTFESGLAAAMSIGEGLPASRYTLFGHFFADQPFVSENVGADERFEPAGRAVLEQMGAASFAAVPLTAGNEWMGYIGVMAKPSGYFDEEKQHLYQTLAEQGAVALRAARLREMIRESEQKFRAVVQSAQAIIFILDNQGVFLLSEGQDLAKLGFIPGQVVGLSAFELFRGNSSVIDAINKALAGELAHVISTVQGIAFDTVYSPYYNLEGQIIGVVGVAIDITERKQAEEALHQRESYLTAIIENQPGLVWLKDTESRFLAVNRVFALSCGKQKPEELIGLTDLDVWPRELAEKYRQDDFMVMKTENSLMTEEPIFDKGEMRWFDTFKTPVRNAHGKIIGTTGFARDITERKQVEQALRESEERLRQIASSLREVIWLRDVQTRQVLYVNPSFEELTGRTCESFYENRDIVIDAIHPDDKEWVIKALEQRFESVPFDKEHRIIHLDGSVRWISSRSFPVRNEAGEVYRWASIMEDITERKRAEEEIHRLNEELEQRVLDRTAQLEATNKELEAFAYSVSHDLRAPLRSIRGFSQAVVEDYADKLNSVGQDYLQRIQSAGERMEHLIDDLLQLSRITRSELHRERVNLSALVYEIAVELHKKQPERQVDFVILPDLVASGDAHLLRIVLENLMHNAWKFTGKQEQATIEFGETKIDGQIVYYVRDDGAGFDMTYADKLFGAFQRLHAATEFEGTGIGLATVQRIIHRHGGRVWAESDVEQGATFYFTLPYSEDKT